MRPFYSLTHRFRQVMMGDKKIYTLREEVEQWSQENRYKYTKFSETKEGLYIASKENTRIWVDLKCTQKRPVSPWGQMVQSEVEEYTSIVVGDYIKKDGRYTHLIIPYSIDRETTNAGTFKQIIEKLLIDVKLKKLNYQNVECI